MVSGTQQSEVIELISRECGIPCEKVRLSNRLREDLGMDGDDAVDFFNRVHERFGTDLTYLQTHWGEHFGPEGVSWSVLAMVPAAAVVGVAGNAIGLSIFWSVATSVALFATGLLVMWRWGLAEKAAITVLEVVAAVEAGVWPSRPKA